MGGSSPARFGEPDTQHSDIAPAPRQVVEYGCDAGHSCQVTFAVDAPVPPTWDCYCGRPAGSEPDDPPVASPPPVYRTPLEYLHERRSDADLDIILDEALQAVAARRRDPSSQDQDSDQL